jgi:hypothetical protein
MKFKTANLIKMLRWVSAITTVVYLAAFFWKLSSRYSMVHTTGLDIEWAVPENPQSMIALCLATATVGLLFLRSSGRALALALFFAAAWFYGQWYFMTDSVRLNMGVTSIPQTNWIGNHWVGAGVLDLVVLVVIGFMIVGSAVALWQEWRKKLNQKEGLHQPETEHRHAHVA